LPPTALLEHWPQVCRIKIKFTVLPTDCFVSTIKKSMKCVENWIPLRIHVRSRNTQPHFKGGPEPSEKLIRKVLVPIGRFHFYFIEVPKKIRPYHPAWYISRTG